MHATVITFTNETNKYHFPIVKYIQSYGISQNSCLHFNHYFPDIIQLP